VQDITVLVERLSSIWAGKEKVEDVDGLLGTRGDVGRTYDCGRDRHELGDAAPGTHIEAGQQDGLIRRIRDEAPAA
jgi:hypothetical protein